MVERNENNISELASDVENKIDDVKEDLQDAKEITKEKFDDAKEKAKAEAKDLKEDMKNFGKSHPFAFLWQLEAFGEEYLVKKAPFQLPEGFKDFLVKIAPYLIIVVAILAIPTLLNLFGLSNSMWWELSRYGYNYGYGSYRTMFSVTSIISLIAIVLELLALPGLFGRKKQWRNLIFYAQLISVIGSLIDGSILWAILSLVIGMYVLFQVRSYYK